MALVLALGPVALAWMQSNRLQLNGEKTEVMWCSSTRRLPQLPNSSIVVAGANVHPVRTVRDLGVYIDSDLGYSRSENRVMLFCRGSGIYCIGRISVMHCRYAGLKAHRQSVIEPFHVNVNPALKN